MHVITKKRILLAAKAFPESAGALIAWYTIVEKNNFNNHAELKMTFNSVDKVNNLYVFNIAGNKLRLIASIHFNRQKIYIREILSHTEYDKGNWK
ncbi:MAG: type II toxin-antitoxin system HigB family toxin [Gammaproteobacteria bacterium]